MGHTVIDSEKRACIRRIVQDNVPASNRLLSRILLIFAGIALVIRLLFLFNILKGMGLLINYVLVFLPLLSVTTAVVCLKRRGEGRLFKYALLCLFGLFLCGLDVLSGYRSRLLLAFPILVSTRYYNRKLMYAVTAATTVYLALSIVANAYTYSYTGLIDLNLVSLEGFFVANGLLHDAVIALHPDHGMLLRNGFWLGFLPNCIYLWVITICGDRLLRFNLMNLVRIDELARRETEQAAELADMRTRIVLSQVKPHFIYNTLTSIASLCTFDAPRAKELTIDFATYLRTNLDSLSEDSVPLCTFSDELAHVKCYMNIELVRFEDSLKVEYDIQADNFMIPVLSVQPLMENAVKHGVCHKIEGGTVKLATREAPEGWYLTVSDDGIGFDVNQTKQDGKVHVGMANVRRRLELYHCTLTVESTPGVGTVSTIFIPREDKP